MSLSYTYFIPELDIVASISLIYFPGILQAESKMERTGFVGWVFIQVVIIKNLENSKCFSKCKCK